MKYQRLDKLLLSLTQDEIIPAIAMAIGHKGNIVYSHASGHVFETGQSITSHNKFDIASLSKIFTTICFMKLIENGTISISDPIYHLFPEYNGTKPLEKDGIVIGEIDARRITWFHVLTHTTGIGWTREKTRPSLPGLDKGFEVIYNLPMAYETGKHIVYSDIPMILLGKAIEILTDMDLDAFVDEIIITPLNLSNTSYLRRSRCKNNKTEYVPTEMDSLFRKKRIWGEVHDENAYLLDGVAGHAGIFSTANDMCSLAIAYNNWTKTDGVLKSSTVREMIAEQVCENDDRRGLMWQLSGCGLNAYTHYLSNSAYGHSGFTGCFLWNDPQYQLTITFLSNDIYNGRENRKLFQYRGDIVRLAVLESLQSD